MTRVTSRAYNNENSCDREDIAKTGVEGQSAVDETRRRKKVEPIYEDTKFCFFKFSKEWMSWYLYDFGNFAYGGFSMAFLIPILVSHIAEEKASNGMDLIKLCPDEVFCESGEGLADGRCFSSLDSSIVYPDKCKTCLPSESGDVIWGGSTNLGFERPYGEVPFLGFQINYASYAPNLVSLSVFLQAIVFITFGPHADYGRLRKGLWLFTSIIGSTSAILFIICTGDHAYVLSGVLVVLSNVLYGFAFACYNAYLPILASAHPEVCLASENLTEEETEEIAVIYDLHVADVSMKGYTWGYVGALLSMVFCLGLIAAVPPSKEDGYFSYRVGVLFTGSWWLLWTFPGMFFLKTRPGPDFPAGNSKNSFVRCMRKLTFGWTELCRILRLSMSYKNLFIFLILFFFFSDMVTTIGFMGVIFAQTELCLDSKELALVAILNMVANVVGGILFTYLKRRFLIPSKTILMTTLTIYSVVCAYMCIGIFSKYIGLRNRTELFLFAFILGLVNGVIQAISRTIYGDFIPDGEEAIYFFYYGICDKASSFIGPLVFGFIQNSPIENRFIFVYLGAEAFIPLVFLYFFVDHRQGIIESGRQILAQKTPRKSEGSPRKSEGSLL